MRIKAAFVLGALGGLLGLPVTFLWFVLTGLTATPSQAFTISMQWTLALTAIAVTLVGASLSLAGKRKWAGWLLLASGLVGFVALSVAWIPSGVLILIASRLAFRDKREGQSIRVAAFVLGLLGGVVDFAMSCYLSLLTGYSSPHQWIPDLMFGLTFAVIALALVGASLSNAGKRKWANWLLLGSVLVGFGAVAAILILFD